MEATAPVAATTAPIPALTPQNAWQPLPASEWNAAAARHLLRRAAWSAQPAEVERAVAEGLPATLNRLFPEKPTRFPRPESIDHLVEAMPSFNTRLRATTDAFEKRAIQKERRDREQSVQQETTIKWLQFALRPEVSAQEKWTLFLSDIYVVSFEKVRNPGFIHLHHAILREHGLGSAPALAKAVSRSPAMIRYLDLQESKKSAPNENFARELFELFTLGEGNYTEQDIKQAARAFTGYRVSTNPSGARAAAQKSKAGRGAGGFYFDSRQHDTGSKTVFGSTGNYTGDDIIDLVYKQPAAATFIPHEMARFYLTDAPFPREYLATLGSWWASQSFNLRALARRFFGSRLFYAPAYVGNCIKCPFQFYFGLLQDLNLDVTPIPRQTISPLRQMGQMPFQPPNVRGWVGGRHWINSATLAARRQLVQNLFTPFKESNLNADEQLEIASSRAAGRDRFYIDTSRLQRFSKTPPVDIADTFLKTFLTGTPSPAYREEVIRFITGDKKPVQHLARVRDAGIALLQSPGYQLC